MDSLTAAQHTRVAFVPRRGWSRFESRPPLPRASVNDAALLPHSPFPALLHSSPLKLGSSRTARLHCRLQKRR